MARRSGIKGSRKQRKLARERARELGLPLPEREPRRSSAPERPEHASVDSQAPTASRPNVAATKRPGGVPVLVKILGGAVILLLIAYGLTFLRDQP
jgi:hypothetical protein